MKKAALTKYLSIQAKLIGVGSGADLSAYVQTCLSLGLNDFWNARAWSFRKAERELDVSAHTETIDVPSDWDDFGGVGTVREEDTLGGHELLYMIKADFDLAYPNPSAHVTGYPAAYTVYRNADDDQWTFKFFPVPSISTVYVEVVLKAPADVDKIPEEFTAGLTASCVRFLHPSGSEGAVAALRVYRDELQAMEQRDSAYKNTITHILDSTDTVIEVWRPWV